MARSRRLMCVRLLARATRAEVDDAPRRARGPSTRWNALCVVASWIHAVVVMSCVPAAEQNAGESPKRAAASGALLPFVYRDWRVFTTRDGLPSDRIRAICVSGERVWVGTDAGLALHDGQTWRSWGRQDGLVWPAVTAIAVDERTREVWLGTWGGGLARFSGGRFDRYHQRNSGLAGDLVFAVLATSGRVWAATNGGISAFDPIEKTWALHFARRADAPAPAMTSLCPGPESEDALYAAEWCGPVRRLDMHRGRWMDVRWPGHDSAMNAAGGSEPVQATLAITAAGRSFWWATASGLLRRDRTGQWQARGPGHRMTGAEIVYCLAAPNDEEAWLATDQGVRVLADPATDTWIQYTCGGRDVGGLARISRGGRILESRATASAIPDDRVRCIAFQGDRVWVGTARGLALGSGRIPWTDLRPVDAGDAGSPRKTEAVHMKPAAADTTPPSKEIPIAVLGPTTKLIGVPGENAPNATPTVPADRQGVQLAIEYMNARGGYRGNRRFVLPSYPDGYDLYGWGTPEDEFPGYAYAHDVVGFVGHLGPGDHLGLAAAIRTEVPLINTATTPAPLEEQMSPWVFRCKANDPGQHDAILDHVIDGLGRGRLAILRSVGGVAQLHLDWWSRHARSRGHRPVADVFLNPDAKDLGPQLRALRLARPEAVLTWCDARTSAAMLRQLREAGVTALFVGSDRIVCREFIRLAGEDPGAVVAAFPCDHRRDAEAVSWLGKSYLNRRPSARTGRRPSPEALFSFDAACHLMEAINLAGPDRDAIREALEAMRNTAMARLEHGEWKMLARSDL